MNFSHGIPTLCRHCIVSKIVLSRLSIMRKIKAFVPISSLLNIYQSVAEPYFHYCSIVWNGIGDNLGDKLQKLQNRVYSIEGNLKISM